MLARFDAESDTAWKRIRRDDRDFAAADLGVAEKRYDMAIDLYSRSYVLLDGPVQGCECHAAPIGVAFDLAGKPDSAIVYLERYLADFSPARLLNGWDAQYKAG